MGHYFEQEFEEWLKTEKSEDDQETRKWRRQFFTWWIKWEECDSGNFATQITMKILLQLRLSINYVTQRGE